MDPSLISYVKKIPAIKNIKNHTQRIATDLLQLLATYQPDLYCEAQSLYQRYQSYLIRNIISIAVHGMNYSSIREASFRQTSLLVESINPLRLSCNSLSPGLHLLMVTVHSDSGCISLDLPLSEIVGCSWVYSYNFEQYQAVTVTLVPLAYIWKDDQTPLFFTLNVKEGSYLLEANMISLS